MPTAIAVNTLLRTNNLNDVADKPTSRSNLGAAARGANSDITSLALTTPLPISSGGTGSNTQNFVDLSTNQTVAGNKTLSGALSVSGSQLSLTSATSNLISFNTAGLNAPTFTTRSVGTKIVLFGNIGSAATDYAIGMTGGTLWNSVPVATNSFQFAWYGGTTELMRLRGDGNLGLGTTTPVAKLQIVGGLAVNTNSSLLAEAGGGYASLGKGLLTGWPAMNPPANPTAIATTGGSLSAGTYYYKILAFDYGGGSTQLSAEASAIVDGTTTNAITFSWESYSPTASYRLYRSTVSGTYSTYWDIPLGVTSYLDTGAAFTGTNTSPTTNTSANGRFLPGLLSLDAASSNLINFRGVGTAAPTFTTRSTGTKIVLYPQLSSTTTDYAIGITGNTLWNSVPAANNTYQFSWYGGTTELMRLRGDGNLGLGTTTPGAKLQIAGGVAITSNGTAATDPGAGCLSVTGSATIGSTSTPSTLTLTCDGNTPLILQRATQSYSFNLQNSYLNIRNNTANVNALSIISDATQAQLIIGTPGATIASEIRIGRIRATSVNTLVDRAGGALVISPGAGTGNATPQDLLFQTSDATVSGATVQTFTTKGVLTGIGNWGFGTSTPGCHQFSSKGVAIASSTTAATDPGAGVLQAEKFKLAANNIVPASATSTGTLGSIAIDGNFIYYCFAANQWTRAALSTW